VARFEAKTLSRSWFFRIFSGLSLVIMTLFTVFGLALGNSPGVFWLLNASIPLANFKFLNILQAVIVIFLAADFLRRDRKLDSTEVIYTRSMSNADYVFGKTLGLLFVFIVLNLIFAVVAGFIHLFFAKTAFVFLPYVKFMLFYSLPTLVFMIGLTFFLMSVIRNQAVTFIILLAYSGIVLFYLAFRYHSIFDFLGFQVAAGDSDFIGMAMTLQTLLQRLSYLFLGISFIFFTIILLRRLIQSRPMHKTSKLLAVVFLLLAIACIGYNYNLTRQGIQARLNQAELNKNYATQPVVAIKNIKLAIQHTGKEINGTAMIVLTNQNATALEKYLLTLNPGLEIVKVTNSQQDLPFNREKQLLWITPAQPLAMNSIDSLRIEYKGKIDENYMFPEVRESERARAFRIWLYHFQKKYAVIEKNYLLLTPESNWYPIAGLPYGANYPEMQKKDFIRFKLTVTTQPKLTAISQGKSEKQEQDGNAIYTFTPEQPLSEISLIVGQYEKRSLTVDNIEYSLFSLKSHDFFAPFFTAVGDTLAALIRDAKNNFENTLSLNYPFQRLNLIETPIQFTNYARPWTQTRESVQPEMVLLPEKGVGCNSVEFDQMKKRAERRREFSGQVLTEQENQARMFMDFVTGNLTGASGGFFMQMNNMIPNVSDFRLLPNFYYYKNHFSSTDWPIFNLAFESYFKNKIPEDRPGFLRSFIGLSAQEKCNIELDGKSIKTVLSDTSLRTLHVEMIQNKGNVLFLNLQNQFGTDVFNTFIKNFLNENQFSNIPVERFIQKIAEQFKIDFVPYFNNWYSDTLIAGFIISNIQGEQILENERTRFQTRLTIENLESVPGLVQLKFFQEGGGGGRGFGFGPRTSTTALETKIVRMNPHERKEIGVILDEAARRIEINTLISKNIPAVIDKRFSREPEVNKKAIPFDGERVLAPESVAKDVEIIVDNEDPGFEIISEGKQGFLQRFFRDETDKSRKYGEVFYWRPPSQWKPTTDANFYGKFIHSAHVIKNGRGENKVAWKAEIPESGQYEVSYYPGYPGMMFFRGHGPGGRGGEGQRSNTTTLNFIVNHDDGEAKVPLEVNTSDAEWTYIGTYFFSKGEAKVLLTDQGNDRFVIADAVRWIKK
jgi:hypothetical protein